MVSDFAKEVIRYGSALRLMGTRYWESRALSAALKLGLFSFLQDGPRSEGEICRGIRLSPRGAHLLLVACTALGLLSVKGASPKGRRYALSPLSRRCLVAGKPGYMGHILSLYDHGLSRGWIRLEEAVKSGKSPMTRGDRLPHDEFLSGMEDTGWLMAHALLRHLPLRKAQLLVDLGGGPGIYSVVFLSSFPHLKGIIFDLPESQKVALRNIRRHSLSSRLKFAPGNLLTDPLPEGGDLVLLSNIVHIFSPEENRKLIAKIFQALPPGGILAISDFLLNEQETGPLFSALFGLQMLLYTNGGGTYKKSQMTGWLKSAGFQLLKAVRVSSTPYTLLLTEKTEEAAGDRRSKRSGGPQRASVE